MKKKKQKGRGKNPTPPKNENIRIPSQMEVALKSYKCMEFEGLDPTSKASPPCSQKKKTPQK